MDRLPRLALALITVVLASDRTVWWLLLLIPLLAALLGWTIKVTVQQHKCPPALQRLVSRLADRWLVSSAQCLAQLLLGHRRPAFDVLLLRLLIKLVFGRPAGTTV
jgi:hypothetical protein